MGNSCNFMLMVASGSEGLFSKYKISSTTNPSVFGRGPFVQEGGISSWDETPRGHFILRWIARGAFHIKMNCPGAFHIKMKCPGSIWDSYTGLFCICSSFRWGFCCSSISSPGPSWPSSQVAAVSGTAATWHHHWCLPWKGCRKGWGGGKVPNTAQQDHQGNRRLSYLSVYCNYCMSLTMS